MFLFSFLSRENTGKMKENYFHESLTATKSSMSPTIQSQGEVLHCPEHQGQKDPAGVFIQREVNNLPNLPGEDWSRVYSCI